MTAGVEAAALALAYLRATQGAALGHLRHLTRLTAVDAMVLDATAVETLELLQGSGGGARAAPLRGAGPAEAAVGGRRPPPPLFPPPLRSPAGAPRPAP